MENQEKELIHLHRTFFWQSEKIIKTDKWDELDKLSERIPADVMHINHKETVALTYIDPVTRKLLGINKENIGTHGATILSKTVEPSNLAKNMALVKDFVERSNKHEVGILFQHLNLKQTPGSDYEWYVSFMKLNDETNGIFTLEFKIKFLDRHQNKFMKLIELDDYVHTNMDKFQELSPREIEILSKVARGASSQEIGEELSISKLTVDTHRKNIMNKLNIKRFVDLIRFAEAFDLV